MTTASVATMDRPAQAVAEQQPQKIPSFGEQLAGRASQFQASLPAHIPVERFMRIVMTAVQLNPALGRADRASLWTSSMKAATDGLLPDGREGALVIYKSKDKDENGRDVWIDKVQWMPMIGGLRKKVRNSGEITCWETEVVHANDHFEFERGDDPFIKHRPFLGADPGPVVAAYSIVTLKGGEKSREVMTRAQLDKVRSVSKSKDKGPWVDWFEEMCRKTVARRHSKVLPMSTDLDDLMRRDDDLYDLKGAREEAQALNGGKPRSLAGKLDVIAQMSGREGAPPVEREAAPIEEQPASDSAADPTTFETAPGPEKLALLERLGKAAAKGTNPLRRALATASEADLEMLTEADHDALGGTAEAADIAQQQVPA